MSGEDFREETMLAAVKPLRTVHSTPALDNGFMGDAAEQSGTSHLESSFSMTMNQTNVMRGLESLYVEHHERVFRTAHRVTGSAADAEDVLQTVFLRLARANEGGESSEAREFEWADNPEAYLSRAAINASLDLLRKRKRSKAVAIDDVEHDASMAAGASIANDGSRRNPAAHHEDRELRNLIREAVARLGEKAGAMFALRYFEGFDNGEIARMMGTSALVVGVTLHRARARLRKEIGRYLHSSA
jgi:RNA polymerase sigma-70 factor, ECF subfamily